jgi:hypothetical protein
VLVSPIDIYSRNANLVLGLIWSIVHKFHIAPTLAQKGPPEKDFLQWLAAKNVHISKLAKYIGIALLFSFFNEFLFVIGFRMLCCFVFFGRRFGADF